jgi:hypothetical protein
MASHQRQASERLHCGNALLCSNLFSTWRFLLLLAFLANVLIFFKCLKVNESHILFSQAPRCERSRVEEGKLHNELHTIVKNTGKFSLEISN